MNVRDSVIACIRNWPSLHPTRLDALLSMFNYSGAEWVNGERINESGTQTSWRDYPETDIDTLYPTDDPYMILCRRRRAAEERFTAEHAELIADDMVTGFARQFFTDCWVPWLIEALNEIPDDVAEDWEAAALEVAHRLWRDTRNCEPKCHGYDTHRELEPFLRGRNITLLSEAEERESGAAMISAK